MQLLSTVKKVRGTTQKVERATREKVLVLRTCNEDLTSHEGFRWPKSGKAKAPDWSPSTFCGKGLHGLLWGEGGGGLLNWGERAKWLVVEVLKSKIVDLGGKVKFPDGKVVFCGDRLGATKYLLENGAIGRSICGGTSISGAGGTSTSGYGGTSTSGYGGTSTSGYRGTSTSGKGGTSTSGDRGTSTSSDGGTSISGYGGTSTSGDRGTSTSGDLGTSTSGDAGTSISGAGGTSTSGYGGTSTSGYGGTSTSGDRGTSTSGDRGTSTSGARGIIQIKYWDERKGRYRIKSGYIGEDGLKPQTKYRLNGALNFLEVGK